MSFRCSENSTCQLRVGGDSARWARCEAWDPASAPLSGFGDSNNPFEKLFGLYVWSNIVLDEETQRACAQAREEERGANPSRWGCGGTMFGPLAPYQGDPVIDSNVV